MKKDLSQDLGARYIQEWIVGACFRIGDTGHWLRGVEGSTMSVDSVSLIGSGTPKFERQVLPLSTLKGFETFRYPTLGYRQVDSKVGPIVVNVSSVRSAHRGLRMDLLKTAYLPVYHTLGNVVDVAAEALAPSASCVRILFNPKFTDFATGVKYLLHGDIAGFAVNEQIAVAISCTRSADRVYDIYFRDRVVGHIDSNGKITLNNKIVARDSVSKALQ